MGHIAPFHFPQDAVVLKNGHAITTSLIVAEVFGKQHKDVLRSINNLDCSVEFSQRNFAPASYFDAQGKPRPMYNIGKDGFIFLGMGFTGPEAARLKEDYILAFNLMTEKLQASQHLPPQNPTKVVDALEDAERNAEFWRVKFELEQSRRENEQLKQQIGKVDERHFFTPEEDLELIRMKQQGFGKIKIAKLKGWIPNSVESRCRKLRKDGRL